MFVLLESGGFGLVAGPMLTAAVVPVFSLIPSAA